MAITVADNFSYQGKKPLDGRDTFATLAAMKAYAEASVYDGCLSYCDEDGKRYEFKSTNTVDPTTGKWREYSSGGGGETYNDFTGATASTAGAHGLVPAPSAGDEGKVLFGNGAWGALPSVDLSVLSNEENILSTTEKVVGQDADGYLIYQRTIRDTVPTASTGHDADKLFDLSSVNIRELKKLWGSAKNAMSTTPLISTYLGITNVNSLITAMIFYNYGNGKLYLRNNNYPELSGASAEINIQYTKTTDSPLPSDVKFAGVTSSGEVVYEKHITGLNVYLDTSNWNTVCNIPNVSIVIDAIAYYNNNGTGLKNTVIFKEIEPNANGDIKAEVNHSRTINEITIRYTTTS